MKEHVRLLRCYVPGLLIALSAPALHAAPEETGALPASTTDSEPVSTPAGARQLLKNKEYARALSLAGRLLEQPGLSDRERGEALLVQLRALENVRDGKFSPGMETSARKIIEGLEDKALRQKLWQLLGKLVYAQDRLKDALAYFERSLAAVPAGDRKTKYVLLMNIGAVQVQLGKYAEATERMLEAEAVHDAAGFPPDSRLYRNIAGLFYYLKNWDKSLEYGEKALKLLDEDDPAYAKMLSNLALAYRFKGDLPAALEMQRLAVEKMPRQGAIWLNLSDVLTAMERYPEAMEAAQKAEAIYRANGDRGGLALALRNIAVSWSKQGELEKALEYYYQALAIYEDVEEPPKLVELYGNMIEALEELGRYREALDIARKKHALSEQLVTAESRKRIAELENAAELRRKERELLLLQKEKQAERLNVLRLERESKYQESLRWFLFAALIAACVIVILLFGVLRLRKRLHEQLITRHIQVKELNLQLQDMSMRDALTGLYNRRYLTGLLAELAKREDAWRRAPMLVVMIDLDHFKNINDLYGHAAGDAVLKYFAGLITKCSRQSDVPVRWGGEEFVLLCAGMDLRQGAELCARLRQLVHASDFVYQDRKIPLSCSFGMALFPLHPDLPPEWNWSIQMADAALYAAKSAGRDRWVAYGLQVAPDWLRQGHFDMQRLLKENVVQATEMKGEGCDGE